MRSFLLLVLLSGCGLSSGPSWVTDTIESSEKSQRFVHKPKSSFGGLECEILIMEEEIFSYLSLTSGKFRKKSQNIEVILLFDEERVVDNAWILAGNQKISLPQTLKVALLKALDEGKEVTIQVDGFEETLHPEEFQKLFRKVKKSFGSLSELFP